MLLVICARLCQGHLSVCVGDSLRRSKEIVKILNCVFQCDSSSDGDDDDDDAQTCIHICTSAKKDTCRHP